MEGVGLGGSRFGGGVVRPPLAAEFKGRQNDYFKLKKYFMSSTDFKLLNQIEGNFVTFLKFMISFKDSHCDYPPGAPENVNCTILYIGTLLSACLSVCLPFFLRLTPFYLFIVGVEGYCCTWSLSVTRNTLGRTPLDEGSARRRDLYLTTHNTQKRQTSMPPGEIRTRNP